MADDLKICANCGHSQYTGLFCEGCGTKLPEAAPAPVPPAPAPAPPAPAPPAPAAAPAMAPAPMAAAAPPPPPAGAPPYYAPQPQYAPAPPYAAAQVNYTDLTGKGFWGRFFDFSFKEFITPSVIKVLFIVVMVVIGLVMLSMIVWGFMWSPATGVVALIAAIIYGFVALLFSRVMLELIMVFFNIHDYTKKLANKE